MTARSSGTRDISVTAKFSADEFARIRDVMGGQKPGTWLYEQALAAIDRAPMEDAIMGELLALRVIVLNFLRTSLAGEPLTMEKAGEHVQAGDLNKQSRGRAALRRVM